ncbi:alanine racemase [Serinibacter salmoneus]|uniref:D-serine deaminase-like pyridoxal phosphate-dependent protein n=1 Tax=Serinibacter salmoneus TaxID=556530 RepID=A0A2A9CWY7_9MICO|nr:alanine racemase [Serinibacter salmoneus]PFG18515.1 D-serine deaminase-like pyridoxal phosphate-dependent protein [Serinibacter salmoneus]
MPAAARAHLIAPPWPAWEAATAAQEPPFAVLDAEALEANAADLVRRAAGKPIRIASKSLRVRGVIEDLLTRPGFTGVLAYTLPEALWLAETIEDVVVGYPSADRAAIAALAREERAAARVTLMVDDVAQLDLIDAVVPPASRPVLRICLELDASWHAPAPLGPLGLHHVGVLRSPVHSPQALRTLARHVTARQGFALVGVMAYEAQIAGVSDAVPGRHAMNAVMRRIKRHSEAELAERRGEAIAAVRELADLEFVNGGGTGSVETTTADPSVTEIAAGSGLFAGHYFDDYAAFAPRPATGFALSVVRKPAPGTATVLGGGWIASGPPGPDRLPRVVHPEGLAMAPREMAGEVQTPLTGAAARRLAVGDRVWLRHAKSGELAEHVNEMVVVAGESITARVPTYRGEGKAFL